MATAAAIVGGSLIQGASARSASRSQERAADAGVAEQRRQFDITQENFEPFRQAALGALPECQAGIGGSPEFAFDPRAALENPAMQFMREQGEQQVDRAAGRNRLLGSGERLMAAQRFGQGLATQGIESEFNRQLATHGVDTDRFNTRLNRLAGLVDVGRGATSSLASTGAQTSGNIANLLSASGQAQAAGQLGVGNVLSGAIEQGVGLMQQTPQTQQQTMLNEQW